MTTPVITLKNGIRVANLSSPHSFKFITGEELPACSAEVANRLKLEQVEKEVPGIKGTIDIELTFQMSAAVREELDVLSGREDIDIVIVPFPVMNALKEERPIGKFRVCRVADRVTKAIFSDKFCR